MFLQIQDAFGPVDILVNNAGISHIGLFTDMTPEQWQLAAEGQTRADTRIRIRSTDIRIRIRHTAIRARIVAPAIDHTDRSGAYPVHVGICLLYTSRCV